MQEAGASAEQRTLHERALQLSSAETSLGERRSEADELHARARRESAQAAQLLAQHQVRHMHPVVSTV